MKQVIVKAPEPVMPTVTIDKIDPDKIYVIHYGNNLYVPLMEYGRESWIARPVNGGKGQGLSGWHESLTACIENAFIGGRTVYEFDTLLEASQYIVKLEGE